MKSKLLIILMLLSTISFGQSTTVPDTETFTLFDILDAVYGNHTSGDFNEPNSDAISSYFDSNYSSYPANSFLRFRNYGPKSTAPTYSLAAAQDFSGGSHYSFSDALRIGTPSGRYDSFGINYSGTSSTSWQKIVIESFNADYDGDGNTLWTIKKDGVLITSFPSEKTVTGIANDEYPGFTVFYDDPSGVLYLTGQRCRITYYIVDSNNQRGASATLTIGAI